MYIVLINGHAGCLKTTLSYLIASSLGLAHVSTSSLGSFCPHRDLPAFRSSREARYGVLTAVVEQYLENDVSIVVDGTFALRRWRDAIYALAAPHGGVEVIVLTCVCSRRDILERRFLHRRQVPDGPDSLANRVEAYDGSVNEFESVEDDRLLDGRLVSLIEFDSGTMEVNLRRTNDPHVAVVARVVADLVHSGRLDAPFFPVVNVPIAHDRIEASGERESAYYIILEGTSGSGKTTQARRLAVELETQTGAIARVIEEFSGGALGSFIRSRIGKEGDHQVQIGTEPPSHLESLLVIADGIERKRIAKECSARYCILDGGPWGQVAHAIALLPQDASETVKTYVRDAVLVLANQYPRLPAPAFTCFLRIPPDLATHRIEMRTGRSLHPDQVLFIRRLTESFEATAGRESTWVDASMEIDEVTQKILSELPLEFR